LLFGVTPELAGRLSKMIFLRPLVKDHLAAIITQPGGPVDELKQRFSAMNCEWQVGDEVITHLADVALRREVGARGIDSVLWASFNQALFQASVADHPTAVRLAGRQPLAEGVATGCRRSTATTRPTSKQGRSVACTTSAYQMASTRSVTSFRTGAAPTSVHPSTSRAMSPTSRR